MEVISELSKLFGALKHLDNNLVTVLSICGSISALALVIKKWLRSEIDKVDLQQTKNFLIRTLAGIERGEKLTEVEKLGLKEAYTHYTNDLHGNTYVKDEYEKAKNKGLI